ncbi:efflux RND transporter periplasmic adaptor subunit [Flavobacterium aquatile]|uniref:RND transporter n=1 Tax=Flavobacterium aquatile LMG 4008 = ATCC 11947 TaxID=1453498 RepID=A0A095TZH0_9FLAO|nr:HlyD family efflux transporter periplasmic adaptor subunit [Flavobacterium aquatile]KGD67793.1 RND transporter [Flavobacterium aquatile LMG 4008 = ATCC 11947]OXA67651.1 RND transporter [Flavobacterium aquatile] [Flavobacterium aquatile LMG 4008 = ATCC 11947]GEC78289.1 transporter [Flavobacterium aquatile]
MKKILAILIGLTLFSCGKSEEIQPINQDIKELVFASGQLEWDDSYNLTAQTDGVLQNANFEVGNTVTKGKTLATLDNEINKINAETSQEQLVISNENVTSNAPALLQLEQNIQFAESKYLQDKKQAERYERLNQQNIGSKVEYENAQLAVKNSLSNLNSLKKQYRVILQQAKQQQIATKGQLKSNQVVRNYNSIIVTESGTVIKKLKNNGEYVKKGEIIATIANQTKVEAVLNVDENSIGKVKLGQSVFIKLNTDKNSVLNGKVSEILSAFDQQTQSFICKVTFDKPIENSLFGTQLEANILVGEKKNALLIPRNYVGFGNKVNVKGKEENVIIKPGIISTEYVEVLEGVTKDDVLLPIKP